MTAQWMLYCLAVGALLSLGALAAERAMRAFRLPQRWVWAAAMLLTLALPAAARWLPRSPERIPAPVPAQDGVASTRLRLADFPAAAQAARARIDAAALDRSLALAWAGLSAASLLALLAAAGVMARRRRGWRAAEVDGVPVLLSADTGPAVVGLLRGRIVLPEWVVRDASAEVRALLLEHEREHLRAGDPRLLALGLAAVALAPWNPAAWWQLRRLRLAMEVDCDARVLARRADVRAYGTLLLEVGRRAAGGRLVAAAAFSEPRSFLERRIRIMTSPRVRLPWLRAGGFGAAALALVAVACETPGPVNPAPVAPASTELVPIRTEARTERVAMASAGGISRAEIQAAVRRHYPEVLRAAATDTSTLMFVIAPSGEIERHSRMELRRKSSAPERLEEAQARVGEEAGLPRRQAAASTIIDAVTFQPGQMGPGLVEVLWVRTLGEAQVSTRTQLELERSSRETERESTEMERESSEAEQASRETAFRTGAPNRQETMITADQARELVQQYLPQVARGGTDAEFVWFLADADGRIVGHGDSGNSHPINTRQPEEYENVQGFGGDVITLNGHEIPVVYVRLKG